MTVQHYVLPRSLPEAFEVMDRHGPDLPVMAGGTVAMPLINEGISLPQVVMGLRHAGLGGIERVGDHLRIGATATMTQLLAQPDVPLLRDAARSTASWAVRNLATVGGNLFTPPPGGDVAVALLALDATVRLAGQAGERSITIGEFPTGYLTTRIAPDELVVGLDVPIPAGPTAYRKFGRKAANTPAVVTVAIRLERDGAAISAARIALGAAGPHPLRAERAEGILVGSTLGPDVIAAAAAAAAEDADPATDAIATSWYRRRMIELHVRRTLEDLAASTPEGR